MAYTTVNKSSDFFNTKLYTGNGGSSTDSITGINFQPDWVWIKARNNTYNHNLYDSVRGLSSGAILSNSTDAQDSTQRISSFDSDGFTLPATNYTYVNASGTNYVAWNWKANGTGSANSDGSISSTVSANDTAGFSIVKYTGTGSAGNVGHGLSTAPKVLINKTISGTNDWFVGHSSIGFTKFLKLNATNAESTNSGIWNDTAPTTDHFTINSANGNTNGTGVEYITYCFAEKKGFSKFGSYTGNGSTDGSFIYTGFAPAFIITKITSGVDSWFMYDNKRSPFNVRGKYLVADGNGTDSNADAYDFLSNGFKVKSTATSFNGANKSSSIPVGV